MPISPEKQKLYPGGSIRSKEWRAIRSRIQARAGHQCEQCKVQDGAVGLRLPDGTFIELPGFAEGDRVTIPYQVQWHVDAEFHVPMPFYTEFTGQVMKIVCTTAHLDDDLVDHSDENLAFLCQKCHNSLDAKGRAARRKGKINGD